MPVTTSYPGVYVTEASSGVHTITGVATSIAAFVGRAGRGPTDEPVTINSFGDFERVFGGLSLGSRLGYAVRDFYLNGGSQAVVVRLHHAVYASDQERTEAVAAAQATATAATDGDAAGAAAAARTKADSYQSAHEKAAADVVAKAAEAAAAATPTVAAVKAAAEGASDGTPAADDTAAAAQGADAAAAAAACRAKADTYTTDPDKSAADAVADAAEAASIVSVASVTQAADDAVAGATPHDRASLDVGIGLEAVSPGAWGNQLRARVDHDVAGGAADLFNLAVRDGLTGLVETHRNLSVAPGHVRRVDKVLANESRLVRVADPTALPATRPAASADLATGQSDVWADHQPPTNTKVAAADMGSDGGLLDAKDFIDAGKEQAKTGLYALRKADLFNLLCIPPYLERRRRRPDRGDRRGGVLREAPGHAAGRPADDVGATRTRPSAGVAGPRDDAARTPRCTSRGCGSPTRCATARSTPSSPCGAVAGIIARTDAERGVWKAPAGIDATLVGVAELTRRR